MAPEQAATDLPQGRSVDSAAAQAGSGAAPVGGQEGLRVVLHLHAGARVRPGEELVISYGDKSNEEVRRTGLAGMGRELGCGC